MTMVATSTAAGSRGQARLTRRLRPGPGAGAVPVRAVRGRNDALVTVPPQPAGPLRVAGLCGDRAA